MVLDRERLNQILETSYTWDNDTCKKTKEKKSIGLNVIALPVKRPDSGCTKVMLDSQRLGFHISLIFEH